MSECPFLSTYDEQIDCFRECAFYNYSSTGGECPFRRLSKSKPYYSMDSKDILESDFSFLKEYYKDICSHY